MAFIIQTALFLAYVTPRLEPTQLEAGVVEIEPTPPPHQPTCPLSTHELEDQRTALTSLDVPIAQPHLVNCSWYRHSSCCSAEDTLRISHAEPEIKLAAPTRKCRDALNLLMCAPCSPDQEIIFSRRSIGGFPVTALRTCERFCHRLYHACGEAQIVLAGGALDRVDAAFSDGLSFCRAVGLSPVADDEGVRECFNAAGPRVGGVGVGLLAAAAASLLLFGKSSSFGAFVQQHRPIGAVPRLRLHKW